MAREHSFGLSQPNTMVTAISPLPLPSGASVSDEQSGTPHSEIAFELGQISMPPTNGAAESSPAAQQWGEKLLSSIPSHRYVRGKIADIVQFSESVKASGKTFGAVKLEMPSDYPWTQIDPKTRFTVQKDIDLLDLDEIAEKARFYYVLLRLHFLREQRELEAREKEANEKRAREAEIPDQHTLNSAPEAEENGPHVKPEVAAGLETLPALESNLIHPILADEHNVGPYTPPVEVKNSISQENASTGSPKLPNDSMPNLDVSSIQPGAPPGPEMQTDAASDVLAMKIEPLESLPSGLVPSDSKLDLLPQPSLASLHDTNQESSNGHSRLLASSGLRDEANSQSAEPSWLSQNTLDTSVPSHEESTVIAGVGASVTDPVKLGTQVETPDHSATHSQPPTQSLTSGSVRSEDAPSKPGAENVGEGQNLGPEASLASASNSLDMRPPVQSSTQAGIVEPLVKTETGDEALASTKEVTIHLTAAERIARVPKAICLAKLTKAVKKQDLNSINWLRVADDLGLLEDQSGLLRSLYEQFILPVWNDLQEFTTQTITNGHKRRKVTLNDHVRRSVRMKAAKGLALKKPLILRAEETKNKENHVTGTAASQVNNYIKWLGSTVAAADDLVCDSQELVTLSTFAQIHGANDGKEKLFKQEIDDFFHEDRVSATAVALATSTAASAKGEIDSFNLRNIPFLPDSLLGALSGAETDKFDPKIRASIAGYIEDWNCTDHFLQTCDLLREGTAIWLVVAELDFEKFESLKKELLKSDASVEEFTSLSLFDSDYSEDGFNILVQCLNFAHGLSRQQRLPHVHANFQDILSKFGLDFRLNPREIIRPSLLKERNISYHVAIQEAGQIIVRYPKTYACKISLTNTVSESVNFASKLWLDYAREGELWLVEQQLLPLFLTFKLFVNCAQLYEAGNKSNIQFSSDVIDHLARKFEEAIEQDYELRKALRERIRLKEVVIDDRGVQDGEWVSDISFANCFPSKVVISHIKERVLLVMTVPEFLRYLDFSTTDAQSIEFIDSSSYRVELHLSYLDEKLKHLQKELDNLSVRYSEWIEDYDQLMKLDEELTLKTYRAMLAEGENLDVALAKDTEVYLKFCERDTESDQTEEIKIERFRKALANLRVFVNHSSSVVEECQQILALKHQQRIRGAENTDQQAKENPATLLRLIELADRIPALNFYAPEFDQVFEFMNEISNFDRACRSLIEKESASNSEFKDMINLGKSFGITIPSLDFLSRLYDRKIWLETYQVIASGEDPFAGKKDLFTLEHLEEFYKKGTEVLSSNDKEQADEIFVLVQRSQELDGRVAEDLKLFTPLDLVDLAKLDSVIEEMEERSKSKTETRVYVNLKTYHDLVDLRAHSKLAEFLHNYDSHPHTLEEARTAYTDLEASGIPWEGIKLREDLRQVDEFLKTLSGILGKVKILGDRFETIPAEELEENKAFLLVQRVIAATTLALAKDDDDSFENSSAALYVTGEDGDLAKMMKYCLCRGLEDGTMIECDRCKEWYHALCVNEGQTLGDDDKYLCPMCRFLEQTVRDLSSRVFADEIASIANLGSSLRIPLKVVAELQQLASVVDDAEKYFIEKQAEIAAGVAYTDIKAIYPQFVFRKLFGAPVAPKAYFLALLTESQSIVPTIPAQQVDTKPELADQGVPKGLPPSLAAPVHLPFPVFRQDLYLPYPAPQPQYLPYPASYHQLYAGMPANYPAMQYQAQSQFYVYPPAPSVVQNAPALGPALAKTSTSAQSGTANTHAAFPEHEDLTLAPLGASETVLTLKDKDASPVPQQPANESEQTGH